MSDDRNFRYFYYEKVGFRGVEEKKSLDILLAEKPSDLLSKLSAFTHRFQLPTMYRKLLWKLLLDVSTADSDTDELIAREQTLHCNDIRRGLEIMLYTDESTSHSKLFVLMYFLEFSELDINIERQFQKNEVKDLLAISDVLVKQFIDDKSKTENTIEEIYWLFRNLISSVRSNFCGLIETFERFLNGLSVEDKALHCHLVKYGVIKSQPNTANNSGAKRDYNNDYNQPNSRPLFTWFVRFYAGIIDQYFLIRMFDRLVGALLHGSRPFLVLSSVGKAILSQLRTELLVLNTYEDITKRLVSPLTVEQSEEVITALWPSTNPRHN